MDVEETREFIRRHHRAVLATRTASGGVQQSPVLATVDGDGLVVVSTTSASVKARNLRREPHAHVCVFTDQFFGPWVYVDGAVEVVEQPAALEGLVDYYRSIAGEHEDWEEYREAMRKEDRVLIRIRPDTVGPG